MKYLFLLLLLSSCVTCPAEKEIGDVFISHFAGYGDCGDYDAIYDDVEPLLKECDYCGEGFDTSHLLVSAPDGAWTAKGLSCYSTVTKVAKKFKSIPDSWKCKKPAKINYDTLAKECQELN
jgi:hypothetical protein